MKFIGRLFKEQSQNIRIIYGQSLKIFFFVTLGLQLPLKLAEHQPSDNIAITSWEQRYSTLLPHELKDFYLATDGFRLTWNHNYAGEVLALGNMTINRIADLRRVAGIRYENLNNYFNIHICLSFRTSIQKLT